MSPTGGLAQSPQAQPAPAVIVEGVKVAAAAAPLRFNSQVEAIEAVDIQARVSGFMKAVAFQEGQAVRAGDILFEIEPDQMQSAVASAEAQLARALAAQNAAQQTLSRTTVLVDRRTSPQASLDDAQATFDMAKADVQNAEAALSTAQLNLSYTQVRAPIAGTIGRSLFSVGSLVGPNSGPLARIVQLDPIRIVFSVPDRILVDVRQKQAGGRAFDANTYKLTLTLANGTSYDKRGSVQFIDNEVSAQTGTVAIRAVFPNPDHILAPGQFVTLAILDEAAKELPLVPLASVSQDRKGKFVYVLGADDVVSRRYIQTGNRINNDWSVTNGLEEGETIVVEGLQRVADGQRVKPHRSETAE